MKPENLNNCLVKFASVQQITSIKLLVDDDAKRHVYLAAPYRGTPIEIEARMRLVSQVFRVLRNAGHFVTSPLLHHYTFKEVEEANDGEYWLAYSKNLVTALSGLNDSDSDYDPEVWVLDVPGWRESSGVKLECATAYRCGIPVRLMQISNNELREVELNFHSEC